MAKPLVEVKVGQVWRSKDKRENGRTVRVLGFETLHNKRMEINERYAICLLGSGSSTHIAIRRLEYRRGWTLVSDPEDREPPKDITGCDT